MCNDLSSNFRYSTPSADSEQIDCILSEQHVQGSSAIKKKHRLSEPKRIGEILPGVMTDIKKRRMRPSFQSFIRFLSAG